MIRIPVFILFFFIFHSSRAQIDRKQVDRNKYHDNFIKRGHIAVEGGVALPFAEFSDKTFSHERAGYANPGYNFTASFRYLISQNFGLRLKYIYSNNPFDSQKFQDDLNLNSAPYRYTYTSDPYTTSGFMIIPTYVMSYEHYFVEVGLGVGILSSTLPQFQNIEITPSNDVNIYSQQTYQASNIAVSFDAGIHYRIYKDFTLSACADVTICDQKFTQIDWYLFNSTGTYVARMPDYLQPFRLIHLIAGIGYQFN